MEKSFEQSNQSFISKVMMHMGLGLLVTFIVGLYTARSYDMLSFIFLTPYVYPGLLISELLLVVFLSRRIDKLSLSSARISFYIYAILSGITFSSIFLNYAMESILYVFLASSVMFLAAGSIGMVVKRDLSGVGRFAILALIGLIVMSIANYFIGSSSLDILVSIVTILVFCALTAYDMQKIQAIHYNVYQMDEDSVGKFAIVAALSLYLDFINIFITLLRLFGKRN